MNHSVGRSAMKKYICAALLCVSALAIAAQLLPPAFARQQSTATWSAELMPRSDETEIKTDLLVEGGQTVLLSKDEEYKIEMELWAPDLNEGDFGITLNNSIASFVKKAGSENKYIFSIEKNPDGASEEQTVSATLKWTYKEKEFSETFVYRNEEEKTAEGKAELSGVSAQFNEDVPVSFTVGAAPVSLQMNGGGFPRKMRYTVNGVAYVLLDGGNINLGAGERCTLDFSMTDVRNNITLTGYGKAIEYVPFPVLDRSAPLIMDNAELELPVSYKWGTIVPSVKIYRLTAADDGIRWQECDKITVQDNGKVLLKRKSDDVPAGTYKAVINWNSSHIIETNFYICHSGIVDEKQN